MALSAARRARDTARRMALQDLAALYPGQYRLLYERYLVEVRKGDGLTPPQLRQDGVRNDGGRFLGIAARQEISS